MAGIPVPSFHVAPFRHGHAISGALRFECSMFEGLSDFDSRILDFLCAKGRRNGD